MKIAFYAPMKAPTSGTPSGDRLIAQLLMAMLRGSGHQVELVSRFRSYDRGGDKRRQVRLKKLGGAMADRVCRRLREDKPDLWFSYHLYHKAPDWIGPTIARKFGIPYVVAEASYAPKQKDGPWSEGHAAVGDTLARTDLVVGLTDIDRTCVMPRLRSSARYVQLPPFVDAEPIIRAGTNRDDARNRLISDRGLNPDVPWLLSVAMMREGDKTESYKILAAAMAALRGKSWHLIVVGDGPTESAVKALFNPVKDHITWMGRHEAEKLYEIYAAADIFVWPAVKETPGMCFLEAGAAGLPAVGSDGFGVPDVVRHGDTGLLARHLDENDFAKMVSLLLDDKPQRTTMGRVAADYIQSNHSLTGAGTILNDALEALIQ